ncbi:hypothetical protein HRbin02_00893 [Candidatus Calditenuaceae archaeon HR02]|nr:hypothetical protein HRbin02_00893 [Candidatus Calditenuaceae archaeon HR02]
MHRKLLYVFIYLLVGAALTAAAYVQDVYPLEQAAGFLSRAQTAGYSEEMAAYVDQALDLIPHEGNPVWIFPTQRTDFALIRNDIYAIIDRLKSLTDIPRQSAAYSQTLIDIRGKIAVITNQIYEAMPYVFFKPLNIIAAIIYLLTPIIIQRITNRIKKSHTNKSE